MIAVILQRLDRIYDSQIEIYNLHVSINKTNVPLSGNTSRYDPYLSLVNFIQDPLSLVTYIISHSFTGKCK